MRVLQISSDRSKRGLMFLRTPAFKRQEAYARRLGHLVIIAFSLRSDDSTFIEAGELTVCPTNSSSRFLWPFHALKLARMVPKPDVVSVQDPFETGLTGWRIARKLRVPLHVQVHTDFLSPAYARLSFVNRIRVAIAGFVLRRAARVRVVSERIKASLQQKYALKGPVTLLPIFADVERLKITSPDEELARRFSKYRTKLLVVARLEPEKNVSLALRSFAAGAAEGSCLIVVGDGRESRQLKALVRTLDISERVFFEGRKDAALYYKVADLVLVPSKYEGYGLVIVEALASGKPVLSTDVGIAREAGAIVTSEEKFAEALADWYKHGPQEGELKDYPYKSFEEYVSSYCNDILAATR